MATYQRADQVDGGECRRMLDAILATDPEMRELYDVKPLIDLVFASGDQDESGQILTDAIKHQGRKALGLASNRNLLKRVTTGFDCEIQLDHDWWQDADDDQREALLAHEAYHFMVRYEKGSTAPATDDIGRPLFRLREHDVEIGWFQHIAARYGSASQERIQARRMLEDSGQFYWPGITSNVVAMQPFSARATGAAREIAKASGGAVTISRDGHSVTIGGDEEQQAAAKS